MKQLEILKFLFEHPSDWKKVLEEEPYCMTIREKDNFVLFMYNQIESDFNIPLVQECRGIVLEKNTWRVLCYPFTKFWNAGQGQAAILNWDTARILEKIDGSMIKLWWYEPQWRVSTMSMIDAKECTLQNDLDNKYLTFYDLFMEGAKKCTLNFDILNKNYTHMFELVGPYNRVVVPYKDIAIFHTGTRDNQTYEELDIDLGVSKPKSYGLKTQEDVLAMAATLPFSEEGYVAVDANWNRVKIKSPAYVTVHHLKNNGDINKKRALALIMLNEHDEFLAYFPEYKAYFDTIVEAFNAYLNKIKADIDSIEGKVFDTRKNYALTVKGMTNSALMFFLKDGKVKKEDWEKHIRSMPSEKIIDYLHLTNIKESLEVKE
jgi:hypothetical protein